GDWSSDVCSSDLAHFPLSGIHHTKVEDVLLCIIQPQCKIERMPVQDIRFCRFPFFCLPVDQAVIAFPDLRHQRLPVLICQIGADALHPTSILACMRDSVDKRLHSLIRGKGLPVSALLDLLQHCTVLELQDGIGRPIPMETAMAVLTVQ